ncbi:MAG: hypothetical protein EBZ49_13875 [Proteobacteria bacterium]|nr:hypothetical protein [Pseudomonadota bacterium]
MSYDEMRFLINRAVYFIENSRSYPDAFVSRLVSYAENHGDASALCEIGLLTVSQSLESGRVAEAAHTLERLLQYCAHLPQFHAGYGTYINRANLVLESIGHETANSSEFINGYEALKEVGEVGLLNHVLAVEHYQRLCRTEEAIRLWKLLDKTAPNAPGVKYWGNVLYGTVKNTPNPSHRVPTVAPEELNFEELSRRTFYLKKLMVAVEEGNHKEVFSLVDKVLDTHHEVNEKTSEFFFAAGASLYTSGKTLDAIPYLHPLVEKFPAYIHYAKLHARLCAEVYQYAESLSQRDRKAPVLLKLFDVLHEHYYAPVSLLSAVAEQHAESGKSIQAKEILMHRLALSPNDADYLGCALGVAAKIADRSWFGNLQNQLRSLISKRPYDLELRDLEKEFSPLVSSEDKRGH